MATVKSKLYIVSYRDSPTETATKQVRMTIAETVDYRDVVRAAERVVNLITLSTGVIVGTVMEEAKTSIYYPARIVRMPSVSKIQSPIEADGKVSSPIRRL